MKLTTIIVNGYPQDFCFTTRANLEIFKNGWCPKRNDLARRAMARLGINSPCRAYTDYVVESVHTLQNGDEIWELGS